MRATVKTQMFKIKVHKKEVLFGGKRGILIKLRRPKDFVRVRLKMKQTRVRRHKLRCGRRVRKIGVSSPSERTTWTHYLVTAGKRVMIELIFEFHFPQGILMKFNAIAAEEHEGKHPPTSGMKC